MAGNAETRERRGQSPLSPAMPPAVTGATAAPDAQTRAEALQGVFPQVMETMFPMIRGVRALAAPETREATARVGNNFVGTMAGLAGATDVAAEAFRRAEMGPAQGPPASAAPTAATAATAASRATPTRPQARPSATPEQVQANAAAQLSQYNVAQLSALQGLLPQRATPVSPQDQIAQTALDYVLRDYAANTGEGASVEQAGAAEQLVFQRLLALMGQSGLLLPTE
jgi:hypothetical protein